MSFSSDCFSGVTHEGTSSGNFEKVNGVNAYIALPTVEFPKDKAILLLTDIFGVKLNNNKLLADDFAKNGFQVYMPDMFEGDPIPEEAMTDPNSKFDRETWGQLHSIDITRGIVEKAISGLKSRGITTLGAVGYCYGARHVVDLAIENTIASAAVAHPSRLQPVEHFQKLLNKSKAPLLINSCEVDSAFPEEACQTADNMLGDGKYAPGYSRKHFLGCKHGFAVRGDMSDPQVKAGKEGAFKATVEWFSKL